jgi:transposase-like protein
MPAELTPLQSQVLAGLLAGASIAAVAREHRIHPSTIYNWRNEHPAFTTALNEARARQHAAMYDAAHDLASRAFETLNVLLSSDDNAMKLRAAQTILRTIAPSGLANHEPPTFASGPEAMQERFQHRDALKALPANAILNPLAAPELYPDAETRCCCPPPAVDTIRHFSTVDNSVQPVDQAGEPTSATPAVPRQEFDTIRHFSTPDTAHVVDSNPTPNGYPPLTGTLPHDRLRAATAAAIR